MRRACHKTSVSYSFRFALRSIATDLLPIDV